MTEEEKAKWLLLGRRCTNCIYFLDLHKYRAKYGSEAISDFDDVDSLCRNEERMQEAENDAAIKDGHVAVLQPADEFVCEHWVPKDREQSSDPDGIKIYKREMEKHAREINTISEDNVAALAKDLGL